MTTTGELSQRDLNKRVTITGPDWSISGKLTRVTHETDNDEISDHLGRFVREIHTPNIYLEVGPFDFKAEGDEEVEYE